MKKLIAILLALVLIVGMIPMASAASSITIGAGRFAPGTLKQGQAYNISGRITSRYKLTSVTVGVYYPNGKVTGQTKTVNPNATSYDISNLAGYVKPSAVQPGLYALRVIVKDAVGTVKPLVYSSFRVVADSGSTTTSASSITIGAGRYAPGTLTQGQAYSISGKITSKYTLTSVTVGVYYPNGKVTGQAKTVNPNATSYDISNLASYVKPSAVQPGLYALRVIAKDSGGTVKPLVYSTFTVKAANSTSDTALLQLVNGRMNTYYNFVCCISEGGLHKVNTSGTPYTVDKSNVMYPIVGLNGLGEELCYSIMGVAKGATLPVTKFNSYADLEKLWHLFFSSATPMPQRFYNVYREAYGTLYTYPPAHGDDLTYDRTEMEAVILRNGNQVYLFGYEYRFASWNHAVDVDRTGQLKIPVVIAMIYENGQWKCGGYILKSGPKIGNLQWPTAAVNAYLNGR